MDDEYRLIGKNAFKLTVNVLRTFANNNKVHIKVTPFHDRKIYINVWSKVKNIDDIRPDERPLRRDKKMHGRVSLSNPNGNIYDISKVRRKLDPVSHVRTPGWFPPKHRATSTNSDLNG